MEHEFLRCPEFIKFLKSTSSTAYFVLLAAVTRESEVSKNKNSGANYIYNNHFVKGELVARYKQEHIAEYIFSHQSRVSRYMKELEKVGVLKRIERNVNKGKILYYQVGIWTGKLGTDSYTEHIWLDEIFKAYSEIAKQKRGERRSLAEVPSLSEMVHMLNKNHPDYEMYKTEWSATK
jgi:predicted transcriptional regulator